MKKLILSMINLSLVLGLFLILLNRIYYYQYIDQDNSERDDTYISDMYESTTDDTESDEIIDEEEIVDDEESEESEEVEDDSKIELPDCFEEDLIAISKTLYGECRGVPSKMEQAAVVWVILNRVDAGYGSIMEVITAPRQFSGYHPDYPVWTELYDLAKDVLTRWYREKSGETSVGRVIPADYLWFLGGGGRNHFRNNYYNTHLLWDWSLENPYEN